MTKKKKLSLDEVEPPYSEPEFKVAWNEWMIYREQKGHKNYVPIGLQKTFSTLKNQSQGNVKIAIAMLDKAMDKNWQGFHPLKDDEISKILYNGKINQGNPGNKPPIGPKSEGDFGSI